MYIYTIYNSTRKKINNSCLNKTFSLCFYWFTPFDFTWRYSSGRWRQRHFSVWSPWTQITVTSVICGRSNQNMEGVGAYGGGKAGGAFDPISFVQRPQVILRAVSWVSWRSLFHLFAFVHWNVPNLSRSSGTEGGYWFLTGHIGHPYCHLPLAELMFK